MDKRKGIILAVVIILLIGLGTFVFANPSERLDGDNNDTNNPSDVEENNGSQDGENTNGSGEEGEEGNTPTDDDRNNSNGNGSNNNVAQNDDEEDSTDVVIGGDDTPSNPSEDSGEDTPEDEPSEPADTTAPVVTILDKTYQGEGPENSIGYINTEVVLTLAEKNLTVTIEKDGETLTFENGMTLSSDGNYVLTVVDESENKTVVEFGIDKTAPVISGIEDGTITNNVGTITVDDVNEVTVLLNGTAIDLDQITNHLVQGTNTIIATDSLNNRSELSFTYDTEAIEVEWLYTLNATYHGTDLADKHYKVIGDGQDLYIELVFTEDFDSTPAITVGEAEAVNMSCAWTEWETERKYYKCDARITIDGEAFGLTNDSAIPISITNIIDEAKNETTVTNEGITDNGTYGEVVYDNEAPVAQEIGITNITHYIENDDNDAEEELGVANIGDTLRVMVRFDEELFTAPTVTIGGVSKKMHLDTAWEDYYYWADVTITKDMDLSDGEIPFTISGYADAAGNEGTGVSQSEINHSLYDGVVLDTIAPVNTAIVFKNIDGNAEYAKVGNRVWLYLTFDERLAQDPTVTINGETANRVQYENDDNWDQDWEKYVFEYVVPEDVTEGEITFEVTNVIDKAGNKLETTITNDDTTDKVVADKTRPGIREVRIENYYNVNGNKNYAKIGDKIAIVINTTELLVEDPTITIGGETFTVPVLEPQYNKYVVYVTLTEDMVLADNEKVEITIKNVADAAGNVAEETTSTGDGNYYVILDKTAPEIYVDTIVDGISNTQNPQVHGSDANIFDLVVKLNGENVRTEQNATSYWFGIDYLADGNYEVTATDIAGNTSTIKFTLDRTISNIIEINNIEELTAAINNQADNQYWIINEGTYLLPQGTLAINEEGAGGQTGWFLPITADNLRIVGKGDVTLKAGVSVDNGNLPTQNFVTIWGDNVEISNVTLVAQQGKDNPNKVVEILGKDAVLTDIIVNPNTTAENDFGGTIYVSVAGTTTTLNNVELNKGRISLSGANSESTLVLNNVTADFAGSRDELALWAFWNPNNAKVEATNFTVTASSAMTSEMSEMIASLPAGTTLILDDGTYELGHLEVNNEINLKGTSENTILNVNSDPISGQAGVYVKANGSISNLTINMDNSTNEKALDALKVSGNTYGSINDYKVSNIKVVGGKSGINIHGVTNATIDGVEISNASGKSISVASSNITVSNSIVPIAGWGYAITIEYKANNISYPAPATVTIANGNTIGGKVEVNYYTVGNDYVFNDGATWEATTSGDYKAYTRAE